jgi:hypothetical protein
MSEVRQALKDAGWRQGVILAPGPFAHPNASGFLVLNQTCDCLNDDFLKEPYLELLPLMKLTNKPDSRLKDGQNPRQIHFEIEENGVNIWVSASIANIFQFDRAEHASLTFAGGFALSKSSLEDLIFWRAQRYLRPAFPDSFEDAFRLLSKNFGREIAKCEGYIDSLLISILPFEELKDEECYEIQLHFMVTPSVMRQPESMQVLHSLSENIQRLFAGSSKFDSPRCEITSLDEMSLWSARNFLDFSRYDYLSFGKEEDAPEN